MDGKQIGDRASAFGKQTVNAGNHAASVVSQAAHKAGDGLSDIGDDLYEKGTDGARTLGRAIQQHPMATVLIAAAIGFGFARFARRD